MKQESLKFSGRASNPATRKFSPAQIAAQKLFAERARAGTLGKGKRKANPVKGEKIFKTGDYVKTDRGEIGRVSFYKDQPKGYANVYRLIDVKANDPYASTFLENGNFINGTRLKAYKPRMTIERDIYGVPMVKRNPDKSKPRAYVKRASQVTGAPPSKRLVSRRKMALSAPAGYFPNPYTMGKSKKKANFPYCVETKATENWSTQSCFKTLAPAKEYAVALSKKYPKLAIRVMQYAGGAM